MSKNEKIRYVMGVAWYMKDQWNDLVALSADPKALDDSFEDWERNALTNVARFRAQGVNVEKIEVDVWRMVSWCKAHGYVFDESARAKYVTEYMNARDEGRIL